ncbi:alpha/beta fold hydrolase [Alteraurantiacibacter aquimixticola]|uniref:Alpha/beta hydrolase n=1 Tax=Alteraurantiacibacter aquimixticola TaxID=2489173 RepID=A0A4T3F2B4_9SPHN|nr:alpha/beta hydrolase [Alteraurantiacibacter aquimixticola]TIX51326.1 alpha/beta hydrolase [Alteraurantiacibacter aquimixticola]
MTGAQAFDRRAIPANAVEDTWLAGDGHAIRHIEWPAPEGGEAGLRGSILFMPGRGDAYEKYLETFEHWRRQGWQVTAADWRGQAGSGRLGSDSVTGHIDDFAMWIADIAAFWKQWAEGRQGPLVLAGHSMGGHLVLRAAADGVLSPAPNALVLSAPMLGVHPEWLPLSVQQLVAGAMNTIGEPQRPAWKWSEKPGEFPASRVKLLTHDAARYSDEEYWREARPELAMGPGSWGWVAAATRSMRRLREPGVLERLAMPVFITSTSADKLVSHNASRAAARRIGDVTFLEFGEESAHEILREADPVRDRALGAIDNFLDGIAAR